jgi:hypothetical protein
MKKSIDRMGTGYGPLPISGYTDGQNNMCPSYEQHTIPPLNETIGAGDGGMNKFMDNFAL